MNDPGMRISMTFCSHPQSQLFDSSKSCDAITGDKPMWKGSIYREVVEGSKSFGRLFPADSLLATCQSRLVSPEMRRHYIPQRVSRCRRI